VRYRTKPVKIEAEIYQAGMEDKFIVHFSGNMFDYDKNFKTLTEAEEFISDNMGYPLVDIEDKDLEIIYEDPQPYIGKHRVFVGDYIITDGNKKYPCRPDIFHAMYELLGDDTNGH